MIFKKCKSCKYKEICISSRIELIPFKIEQNLVFNTKYLYLQQYA